MLKSVFLLMLKEKDKKEKNDFRTNAWGVA